MANGQSPALKPHPKPSLNGVRSESDKVNGEAGGEGERVNGETFPHPHKFEELGDSRGEIDCMSHAEWEWSEDGGDGVNGASYAEREGRWGCGRFETVS